MSSQQNSKSPNIEITNSKPAPQKSVNSKTPRNVKSAVPAKHTNAQAKRKTVEKPGNRGIVYLYIY